MRTHTPPRGCWCCPRACRGVGWRVGWLAYPDSASTLRESLLKVQDTMVICPPAISQAAAVGALKAGKPFVEEMKKSCSGARIFF